MPASATSSGQTPGSVETGFEVESFQIFASPGQAVLGGAFLNLSTELEMVSPSTSQLTISLIGNTFNPLVGYDKHYSRAVLDSLLSQQDEPEGWNSIVRGRGDEERYLRRLSDTQLQLTVPQYAQYSISSPETLDIRLPGYLVSAKANLSSPNLLVIQPRPGRASISGGTLPDLATETALREGATLIEISILGDTFVDGVNASRDVLDSLLSQQDEAQGWNSQVRPALRASGSVSHLSERRILVSVPRVESYFISTPETVRLALPAGAVASRVAPIMAVEAFVLRPKRGSASLETPALGSEALVQVGSGEAASSLVALAVSGLADVSQPEIFTSLNITLDGGEEWSADFLEYVDEDYEVCVYEEVKNITLPRLENISICVPSPNATDALGERQNGTCAYAGNGTNASNPATWHWGFAYPYETWVDGDTNLPIVLPRPLRERLPIGGFGWREARRRFSISIDPEAVAWLASYEREQYSLQPPSAPPALPPAPPPSLLNATNLTFNTSNVTNASSIGPCTLYTRRLYSASTLALLRGFVSERLEASGWMRTVAPHLTGDMLRRNGSTVTLTLPPQLEYNIESPERLSVKVPRAALRSQRHVVANDTVLVQATGGRVRISGSFADNLLEAALQSPQFYTLVFTLEEESWDASMGHDAAAASAELIQSVLSDQHEPQGWNAIVQPQLQARHLKRVDDQTLVLTIPPFPDYEISEPESLQFVVPPAAVASRQVVPANVSLVVMPTVGFATLNGSLLDELSEGYLCAPPPLLLDVTLHADEWEANVTAPNSTLLRTLVEGFAAITPRVVHLGALLQLGNVTLGTNRTVQQYLYTGWDDTIQPRLQAELLSTRMLRFTVPAGGILVEEVVELTIAPELVRSRNPPLVRPMLRIQAAAAAAYGNLLTPAAGNEYALNNHSTAERVPLPEPPTLVLVLAGDRWDLAVGEPGTNATSELIANIRSYQNQTTGESAGLDPLNSRLQLAWLPTPLAHPEVARSTPPSAGFNHRVRPLLDARHVARQSDDTVIVTLPPAAEYSISYPETITVTVPASAVAGKRDLLVPYNFTIAPTPGVITLSGPPIAASSEAYMRDAILNRTILVTLQGDEWDPAIMAGRATRSLLVADESPEPALIWSLINGLSSAQHEPGGFDAVLQLNRSAVRVRVPSPTELEIDLPPMEAFDILRPETLTLAIPPGAVVSRSVPLVPKSWIILPSVGIPSLRDAAEPDAPLLESVRELALQINGTTIFFHILSDSFTPEVGGDSLESVMIVDSITSRQSEEHGWNAIVRRSLDYRALQRISDSTPHEIEPLPHTLYVCCC